MRAVVSAFLRQRGVSARDLRLPELVALGHLLCGLPVAELWVLDSRELRWVSARGEHRRSPRSAAGTACCLGTGRGAAPQRVAARCCLLPTAKLPLSWAR